MATPTPTNQHKIQPEKPKEPEEESSIQRSYDDTEVVEADQTEKSSISSKQGAMQVVTPPADVTSAVVGRGRDAEDESARERLKRHRVEMGGRVRIPDTWGQENLLKNWIDCTAFDASLLNNSILSARAALMQQRATTRSTNNLPLRRRIENRC